MKIQKFTKSSLPPIRAALSEAFKSIEEKFEVSIDLGSCRFRPHGATFKLSLSTLSENGVDQGALDDFMHYATYRGFDKEDFGRDFTKDGRQFKIVGWTNRRRKYPVDVREIHTGIGWKFGASTVLRALDKPVNSIL